MPWRSTSMTPRLPISPCSRARNFWRGRAVVVEIKRRQQGRLGRGDEGAQLDEIDGPCPVIGLRIAEQPIVQADEGLRLLGKLAASGRRPELIAPVMSATMRASRPFSEVSVFMPPPATRSREGFRRRCRSGAARSASCDRSRHRPSPPRLPHRSRSRASRPNGRSPAVQARTASRTPRPACRPDRTG